jgi:hypothetical protein
MCIPAAQINHKMVHRIGTFFIMIGLFLAGIFILSDLAKAPVCNFMIYGMLSIIFGLFLWFRSPLPAGPPPDRFRLLRISGKKAGKKPDK